MDKRREVTAYEILQIGSTASAKTIRQAYLRRSLETHPDKTGGKRGEFDAVQKAYEALCTTKRERYVIAEDVRVEEMEETRDGWFYGCRCGEGYSVGRRVMEIYGQGLGNGDGNGDGNEEVVVACSGCSLAIRVVGALA